MTAQEKMHLTKVEGIGFEQGRPSEPLLDAFEAALAATTPEGEWLAFSCRVRRVGATLEVAGANLSRGEAS